MAHEAAKAKAKRLYNGRCVFSGRAGVDGAHIYSAGDFRRLADNQFNIVPMWRALHSEHRPCFDTRADGSYRPTPERLWMLRTFCLEEFKPLLHKQLRMLATECLIQEVPCFEPEVPKDEKVLRDMQSRGWANRVAEGGRRAVGLIQETF